MFRLELDRRQPVLDGQFREAGAVQHKEGG
jgi:hypothetical protein